ncbi:exo-alpha-sialidase [Lysinibacillus sp. FSL K6-3209]|uniref:exo-alpha-sialidase n=1 Tax=Lysinibacillus sp. FSL K6-3209 TaxID=2921497 RepID=UPI0030DC539E
MFKVGTFKIMIIVLFFVFSTLGSAPVYAKDSSNPAKLVYQTDNLELKNQGKDITNNVKDVLDSESTTIIIKFKTDNQNALQALFSSSNNNPYFRNNYFDIFMRNNGELGIEVRDATEHINYLFARPASLWGKSKNKTALNAIAFVANAEEKSYKLFANGDKILEENVSNYKSLTDIYGVNTFLIGGVNREGKLEFGFDGEIYTLAIYNGVLTDDVLLHETSNALNKMIFTSGDASKANYFRIPALYTLNSGRVLASADARYGGTHDSRSKINIVTSYSDDNGRTWTSPKFALKFDDYEEQTIEWPRDNVRKNIQISGSASFIDSALVQDKQTNKVILMADFMPAGIGNHNALKNDSGYKEINGTYYLKLRKSNESTYHYSIRENGVIFNDTVNQPTEYKVDAYYNLMKNDDYLYVPQYSVRFDNDRLIEYQNGKNVKMNIFYKDSLFKITPTNYLGFTISDDLGETWGAPKLLPPFNGLNKNATYLSPGQGIVLSNMNRIIFATYTNRQMVYLISDDHGNSWSHRTASLPFTNATAEAQMVELSPGVIQTYLRTSTGKIGYMTSTDYGDTWSAVQYLEHVQNPFYGTQLSIIKYSQKVNGHDILLMSTPNSKNGRRSGQIWVGTVNETNHSVNWQKKYDVDFSNYGYSYSAITELPNQEIGLLYEKYDSWSRNELHLKNVLKFEILTLEDIYQ